MRKASDLSGAIQLGRYKMKDAGAVLVLVDADDDCAVTLATSLAGSIPHLPPSVRANVVVAVREFEAWFLAAAQSLRRHRKVRPDAVAPANPEAIRGAKEFLEQSLLRSGQHYEATVDQASFADMFDFDEAAACRSFRKLLKELDRISASAAV